MAMTSYKSFNAIETYFVKYFLEAVCSAQFMGRCTNMVKKRECYHKRIVTSCRHLACWLAPDWITGLAKGMLGSDGRWKDMCYEVGLYKLEQNPKADQCLLLHCKKWKDNVQKVMYL